MKTKLPLIAAVASALAAPLLPAQDERPPQPPPGEGPREPRPPRPEGERGPDGPGGEREPGRRNFERGGNRPEGERGPGGPERQRPEGPRPYGVRPDGPRGETGGNEREFAGRGQMRAQKPTPYIGVMTSPMPPAMASQMGLPEGFGLIVEEVVPDSPGAKAGLQRYDVLKQLDDQQLVDPNQLAALVRKAGKDQAVNLTVLRKGQEQKVSVTIGERMLPERGSMGVFGEIAPRIEPFVREAARSGEEVARRMQETMRNFQQRTAEWQKKLQEWQKNPTGTPPEAPKLEMDKPPQPPRAPEPPKPSDLLRDSRPGGPPQVRVDRDGNVTTWNTAQARVVVKDDKGEVEVRSENGHRTVTAKDPAGEVVFTGSIDTEEQRRALPEPIRKKLAELHANSDAGPNPQADAGAIRSLEEGVRRFQPQQPPNREIQ